MFVISRVLKFEKNKSESFIERFSKNSPMTKSKGFLNRQILINKKNSDFDIVRVLIYWKDKKAFYIWEGSPEHIALHKNKDSGHAQRPEGLIESSHEEYELLSEQPYDGD